MKPFSTLMSSVVFAIAFAFPEWTLTYSEGPTTQYNLTQNKYTYANGTSSPVAVPTTNVTFLAAYQSVAGNATEEPAWPTWLTPLQLFQNQVTTTVPTIGDPYMLAAGKTYYCDHVYDRETGYQLWTRSEIEAMLSYDLDAIFIALANVGTDITAERSRLWYHNSRLVESAP